MKTINSLKEKIINALYSVDETKESLEALYQGYARYKDKGGKSKLIIYPNGDSYCETLLSDETLAQVVKYFEDKYIKEIKTTREMVNTYFDETMKEVRDLP